VAGTLEPFFLDNAARWAAALRDATADVVMSERAAGHDHEMWPWELYEMMTSSLTAVLLLGPLGREYGGDYRYQCMLTRVIFLSLHRPTGWFKVWLS